jgi:hypothetical protein
MAIIHIMQDIQDNIHCMWACTILLSVNMPCSLNDQNDLSLQLLQVPLVRVVLSTKIGPISHCLLTAHQMVHSAGWSDIFTTLCGFSEVHKPIKAEIGFITIQQAVYNGAVNKAESS